MCKYKVFILSILQSYGLHWYHSYILNPGMDATEAIVHQHLYCPIIRPALWNDLNNCDTFHHTKQPNTKYGKLPTKEY